MRNKCGCVKRIVSHLNLARNFARVGLSFLNKLQVAVLFLFLTIFMTGCAPVASGDDASAGSGGDDLPAQSLESRYMGTYSDGNITFVLGENQKGATSIKSYKGQQFEWTIFPIGNGAISGYTTYGSETYMVYFYNGYVYFTNPQNNDLISLNKVSNSTDISGIDFSDYEPEPEDETPPTPTPDPSPTIIELDNYSKVPTIVIVANSYFKDTVPLKKYINHKKKQGFPIKELYYATDPNRNPETIRSDLKSLYNTNKDMCVLIVGRGTWSNSPNIPEFVNKYQWSGYITATDLYYGDYEGDLFPEVSVGRLSARNTNELDAQVEKIIYMEEGITASNAGYLKDIMLIEHTSAIDEQTYFRDEIQELKDYVNNSEKKHTIKEVQTATVWDINSAINAGASLASYTGHGAADAWGNFNVSHVNSLNNKNKYPVVLGVTCNSGNYTFGEACLGEAFMRKKDGGAIGYVGASSAAISHYSKAATAGIGTIPGMVGSLFWSDKYDPKYKVRTLGGMFRAALRSIKMIPIYSSERARNYSLEVFNLFGDPTYMPYTDTPKNINLDNYSNNNVTRGGTLTVNTNAPYAQVAVTQLDGTSQGGVKIIDAKIADENGSVTLTIPSGAATGQATLYAIAPNHPGKEVVINIQSASSGNNTPNGIAPNSSTPESQPTLQPNGNYLLFAPGVTKEAGWHDANKTGGDNDLCWAATSSNLVAWWQDLYVKSGKTLPSGVKTSDTEIFSLFKTNFGNSSGTYINGLRWYFVESSSGRGGYLLNCVNPQDWSAYSPKAYKIVEDTSNTRRFTTIADFSSEVIAGLKKGAMGLKLTKSGQGGHAITLWGAEYDTSNQITAVYVTDSDDRSAELKRYELEQKTDSIMLKNYSVDSWQLDKIHGIMILYAP